MMESNIPNRKVGNRDTKRIKTLPFSFRSNTDVAIYVADLNKAEEFYGEVMGFRLVSKSGNHLEYDSGALRLYIHCGDPSVLFVPSLDVNDLAGASKYLEDAGCTLIPHPDGGMHIRDPFGFLFDLIER
jgi:catechol 2,3-dioxygenase-like lactoylglutathione lyase family enzyme